MIGKKEESVHDLVAFAAVQLSKAKKVFYRLFDTADTGVC